MTLNSWRDPFVESAGEHEPERATSGRRVPIVPPDLSVRLPMTHYWRVHTRLPERFGQPCRVLARGRRNTILVEFGDGWRVTTSRNYVRRLSGRPEPPHT